MAEVPSTTGEYSEVQYWETRFEKEEKHEWFADYTQFRHLLQPYIPLTAQILILGSGTSNLPLDLLRDGFRHITATDISQTLITKLKQRGQEWKSVRLEVADMLALNYEDGTFDVVIEKGTLDVLFANAKSPWDPPASVRDRMELACHEIHRVLKADGQFFSISFTQPHFRKPYFSKWPWKCDVGSFGEAGSFEYFVYRLNKGEREIQVSVRAHVSQWHSLSAEVDSQYTADQDDSSFLSHIDL